MVLLKILLGRKHAQRHRLPALAAGLLALLSLWPSVLITIIVNNVHICVYIYNAYTDIYVYMCVCVYIYTYREGEIYVYTYMYTHAAERFAVRNLAVKHVSCVA